MLIVVPPGCMPVVAPRHGTVVGGGTTIIGLVPPEPISVEPSGIPVGRTVDPVVPSEGRAPEVTPVEVDVVEPVVQSDIEPVDAVVPPPSNVPVYTAVPQPPRRGLRPPGVISVAPMGIPVPTEPMDGSVVPVDPIVPVEFMPGAPSGEVAPIPEDGITLWA